jgi:hypothetical protein
MPISDIGQDPYAHSLHGSASRYLAQLVKKYKEMRLSWLAATTHGLRTKPQSPLP